MSLKGVHAHNITEFWRLRLDGTDDYLCYVIWIHAFATVNTGNHPLISCIDERISSRVVFVARFVKPSIDIAGVDEDGFSVGDYIATYFGHM